MKRLAFLPVLACVLFMIFRAHYYGTDTFILLYYLSWSPALILYRNWLLTFERKTNRKKFMWRIFPAIVVGVMILSIVLFLETNKLYCSYALNKGRYIISTRVEKILQVKRRNFKSVYYSYQFDNIQYSSNGRVPENITLQKDDVLLIQVSTFDPTVSEIIQ